MTESFASLPFQDLRLIGGGAFNDVYAAVSPRGPVVLKIARPVPRSDIGITGGVFFAQGRRYETGGVGTWALDGNTILDAEARVLGKVQAPAFVRLLEVKTLLEAGASAGEPAIERRYLVLEAIPGRTWREAMSGLADKPTARHVLELARVLAAEIAAGRLEGHGDLKPENLCLEADGRVRILDPSSGMTERGPHGGAVAFLTTERYDPGLSGTDLPALGLLLAEVLTGSQLITAARRSVPAKLTGPELGLLLQVRARSGSAPLLARLEHLPLPSELAPGVPRALEAIALRGLGIGWDGEKLERVAPFADVAAFATALAEQLDAPASG